MSVWIEGVMGDGDGRSGVYLVRWRWGGGREGGMDGRMRA